MSFRAPILCWNGQMNFIFIIVALLWWWCWRRTGAHQSPDKAMFFINVRLNMHKIRKIVELTNATSAILRIKKDIFLPTIESMVCKMEHCSIKQVEMLNCKLQISQSGKQHASSAPWMYGCNCQQKNRFGAIFHLLGVYSTDFDDLRSV